MYFTILLYGICKKLINDQGIDSLIAGRQWDGIWRNFYSCPYSLRRLYLVSIKEVPNPLLQKRFRFVDIRDETNVYFFVKKFFSETTIWVRNKEKFCVLIFRENLLSDVPYNFTEPYRFTKVDEGIQIL